MALTFVKASGIDITGNYTVNSIDASANVSAGNVKTNNLLYANGTAWSLGGTYSNTNVAAYLPTYTGNVSANYFIGNGSTLTSLTGSNVIGYVPNANIANSATIADTVTTAAQPNITSVGTLSSLTVSGLITATGTGIKTANIQDSTGTITITTKYGNVAGDAGIYGNLTVGTSGAGNVTATYFIGNGSQLTGLPASYSNTNVAAYLPTYTGNVSANYFIGNGSTLTNITGANVTGYVPNANLANTATSATTAGTVTTNAQPNITSIGSLTGLVVSGDATVTGNLTVSGNTEYTNVTNLYVKDPIIEMGGGANGAPLSSNDGKDRGTLLHYYTTETVDAFMGWDNSNSEFGFGSNVNISNEVVTFNSFGNIRAGYFIGNGSTLTSVAGANVTGYVPLSTTANTAGTVTTNAQPNITSVGTLTSLAVTGNISSGNANLGNLVTANYFIGNGSQLTGISGTYSNTNVAAYLPTYTGNVSANYFIGNGATLTNVTGANVTGYVPTATNANTVTTAAQPNITSLGTLTGLSIAGNIIPTSNVTYDLGNSDYRFRDLYLSGNTIQLGGGNISISGNSMVLTNPIGGQFIVDGAYSEYSGVANTVSSNAQPNITSVGTLTGLTSTGIINFSNTSNVTIGNVGNFHIPGGSADYVLTTDGTGNLSWEAQSGGNVSTTIAVDNFTGNGVQDTFTLSVPPSSINSVFVNYNGVFVGRSSYSLSGANLTFGSSPANGSNIEVTTINGLPIGSGSFTTRVATGDNSTANYTVTSGSTVSSVLVTLDGVLQTPTTDYTVSSSTLTFTTAPASNVAIQIRELAVAVATSNSAGASWTYSAISANTTAVAGYRYIVDTSSSNLTITLPAAGTLGDEVMIIDGTGNSSTHAITVDRNGGKIQGLTSNMTVTTDRAAFTLVYYNSTQGWILTNV